MKQRASDCFSVTTGTTGQARKDLNPDKSLASTHHKINSKWTTIFAVFVLRCMCVHAGAHVPKHTSEGRE